MADKCPKIKTKRGCIPRSKLNLKRQVINGHKVTLQCAALSSLERVDKDLEKKKVPLVVVSSYRTCAEQKAACDRICGKGCAGCPGKCAPCGESYHQIGLAVDLYVKPHDASKTIKAMKARGWNRPLPTSDPWHFSYRVNG